MTDKTDRFLLWWGIALIFAATLMVAAGACAAGNGNWGGELRSGPAGSVDNNNFPPDIQPTGDAPTPIDPPAGLAGTITGSSPVYNWQGMHPWYKAHIIVGNPNTSIYQYWWPDFVEQEVIEDPKIDPNNPAPNEPPPDLIYEGMMTGCYGRDWGVQDIWLGTFRVWETVRFYAVNVITPTGPQTVIAAEIVHMYFSEDGEYQGEQVIQKAGYVEADSSSTTTNGR